MVVVDDADRENEGDLDQRGCSSRWSRSPSWNPRPWATCLCLTPERRDELELRPTTDHNETPLGTAFTVSIEAREGVSTGISAQDRARTIQVAIDPSSVPHDLVQPGHVFPLRAKQGGVLRRAGQTEAAVDLARLAGLLPAGVVCEIMNDDGTMARVPDLTTFCDLHGLKMVTVADRSRPTPPREAVERAVSEASDRVRRVRGDRRPGASRPTSSMSRSVRATARAPRRPRPVDPECLTATCCTVPCHCGEQLEVAPHASRPREAVSSCT